MSATKSKSSEKTTPQEKSFVESLQDFLGSIKFAIILLTCIALGSILGTIIKQGGRPDEYLSLYSENIYRIITLFGLDDVYHSPWFFALLFLFAINLTLCTLRRFMPIIRGDKKTSIPNESTMASMASSFRLNRTLDDAALVSMMKGYRCAYSSDDGKVFQRGSISKYGVLLIHASIMLILIGGFVGLITGFKGFMMLHKGDMKNSVTIGGDKPQERPFGFTLRCKDFQVSFYPNGTPKDYVSTVEIIEGGQTIFEKQIRVNDPLSYKGIHVYQASYGKTPSLVFNVGGERVTLKERETFRKNDLVMMPIRFEQNIHNFGPGVMVVYLDQGEPRTVWFLKNIDRFNEKNILAVPVRLEDIHEEFYTGLSVSKDPGVWIVWTGFAFILCGLYINFFKYFRIIYVRYSGGGYLIAGTSTKNKEAFREEFERIRRRFNGITS